MVLRGLNAWQSSASEKSGIGLRRAGAVWSQSSARDTGCSRMVRSSGCRSVKPGRSAALLAYTTQRPRWLQTRGSTRTYSVGFKWNVYVLYWNVYMYMYTKLSSFKSAITQDGWLFPLQLSYELIYTYWAQLGFIKVTSYIYDNCRYSFQWNNMTGTLDDQEEDCDKSLLRNRATPATDQNRCRHTTIYERSVISGSHSRRRREAHYTFLQHLIQRITNQRLYTDDIPTSPKRSTYSDIMLKESLYIAGLLVTIFFYLNISQHNTAVSC